ncbi:MAG: hypothetical protein WC884_00960 [Candidatus Paceibacterota bacterium]
MNYKKENRICKNSKKDFTIEPYGLRKKSYCILNKQYTKEEYKKLVLSIIENIKKNNDWGIFFPIWMSPFAYNQSIANEYIPLTKEEALNQGFKWRDDIPSSTGQENCTYKDLPDNPEIYDDASLLSKILKCELCNKNYRFISREIGFYKRMKLSLPLKCFNCRHQARMNLRNPRTLNKTECVSCGTIIQTTYPKEKHYQYKIYCEDCYKKEIY